VTNRVTTRLAARADVERLTALINAAYDAAEGFFLDGPRISDAEVIERITTGEFLVAEDRNGVYACVYLRFTGDRAYLGLLAVDPARQKHGVGAQLLDAAEAYCAERHCTAIDIVVVNLREELFPRYEARGYQRTGTAPFEDPRLTRPAHFVRMAKSLSP
jgi:N-acetylglutamate synthase-like GNAT family acetyltransferase